YYKFVRIADPETIQAEQMSWCEELGLKGRIIIAHEGINGTLSGTVEGTEEYCQRMQAHPVLQGTEFKVDEYNGHAFKRLSIKVRAEIVTLGIPADPITRTGIELEPREFRARLEDPEVIVLDIRNDYEYEMGRFRGAVRPPVTSFKEFPDWLRNEFGDSKERPLLTYCTGGIRCEKLTAFLLDEGFQKVYQLNGGIVTYAKDREVQGDLFDGDCFMFDDRLSVHIGPPVSNCEKCSRPSSRYVNCSNVDCNRLYFLCEECERDRGLACKEECEHAQRQRERNARLEPGMRSESHRARQRRHRAKRRLEAQIGGGSRTL
ncbi:MAG: rhodanese-related sulfurtransferase, partial [Fimbriimonadaceae bacterium]|nr:rhodanese-related sulfurtransferase [Fimbriimonadaceae bacterium]